MLFDIHVCLFDNSNMTFQDAHFHTLQADDRTKAALFVERYDKAMADPATKLKVHRVSHYLASGALGLDLRAYATGSPMSKKLRTEITAYQLCMLDYSGKPSCKDFQGCASCPAIKTTLVVCHCSPASESCDLQVTG